MYQVSLVILSYPFDVHIRVAQNASGSLQYLRTEVLPKLVFSPEDEDTPLDLSVSFVQSLEWLMLAQAQECYWQKARLGIPLLKPFTRRWVLIIH